VFLCVSVCVGVSAGFSGVWLKGLFVDTIGVGFTCLKSVSNTNPHAAP
jgi:hypothetical protein